MQIPRPKSVITATAKLYLFIGGLFLALRQTTGGGSNSSFPYPKICPVFGGPRIKLRFFKTKSKCNFSKLNNQMLFSKIKRQF